MALTIVGCYAIAILLFSLLARRSGHNAPNKNPLNERVLRNSATQLDSSNVSGRWALAPFVISNSTLAFSKRFETVANDGREVNENVLATIFRSNGTEAFGFIKPLNATFNLRHQTYL